MKISRSLLKRSALLSGFYLSFILLVFYIIFNNLFFQSQKENLHAEILSISKLIEQNYGIGNLISLKRNLSNIAQANGWAESRFVDIENKKYWEFSNNETALKGRHILWAIVTFITSNTNLSPYFLAESIKIESWNGKMVGTFYLKRSIKKEWLSHLSRMFLIGLLLFISWVLYQFFIWYVSQKTLKPLELLSNELNASAKQVNIKFENQIGQDEIQRIRGWFNQIALAWKAERARAIENERLATIGQTTSMLAHDVRRPLSQVRVILDAFDMFKNNPSRLITARNDVEKAISNVEGTIADVMDFSREVKLETTAKSLGSILDFIIRQVAQSFSNVDIDFKYSFNAKFQPLLDEDRFCRVLSNIIGNAFEAITVIGGKTKGTIKVVTQNYTTEKTYTEIIIANDGPLFPNGVENQLFESFYTANKKKGTGLGLASAKKIVMLHGGEIFARNKKNNNGVEFVIRLPASKDIEAIDLSLLPHNSNDIMQPKEDLQGVNALIEKAEGKVFKIVLLEDEALYRAWVKNLIQSNENLQKAVVLYDASTVEEALQLVKKEQPTHAIVDIDLGTSKNGYDFLDAVKEIKSLNTIVHSNRTLEEFKQKAIALGASGFVPKPLPLSDLVEFLLGEKVIGIQKPQFGDIKNIYCCDDSQLIRDHLDFLFTTYLENNEKVFEYQIFEKGEDLIKNVKTKKPDLILTDLNMRESGGQLNGYEVIKSVKKLSNKTKAYLISNEPLALSEAPTQEAGGDGALEQPLDKGIIFPILDKIFCS